MAAKGTAQENIQIKSSYLFLPFLQLSEELVISVIKHIIRGFQMDQKYETDDQVFQVTINYKTSGQSRYAWCNAHGVG